MSFLSGTGSGMETIRTGVLKWREPDVAAEYITPVEGGHGHLKFICASGRRILKQEPDT